jgi:effector-binding domain-containing protein
MGYIPPSVMAVYSKSVAGQDFDITQYIPNSASYKTSAKRWKLIHLKVDGTVADTYHSTGCSHTYAEWYNAMIRGGKVGASTV